MKISVETTVWVGFCLLFSAAACGADGIEAPRMEPPANSCQTVDDTLATFQAGLDSGELDGLSVIFHRLVDERGGARVEQVVRLILAVVQTFPREEVLGFDWGIVIDIIDSARPPLVSIIEFLAEGPSSRRGILQVLNDAMLLCPRDSLILTVDDFLSATDLMAALGETLSDELVVGLLVHIPDSPDEGREGFIALTNLIFNAILSPNFDFSDLRALLSFMDLDEPPLSTLLTEGEEYLQGESLEHLRLTATCLKNTDYLGESGVDVLGGLLYDLLTLDQLDLGELLSVSAPLFEELQADDIQTFAGVTFDLLITDLSVREIAIDLLSFFMRSDNAQPLMEAFTVLLESTGVDDLMTLMHRITIRCPEHDANTDQ